MAVYLQNERAEPTGLEPVNLISANRFWMGIMRAETTVFLKIGNYAFYAA